MIWITGRRLAAGARYVFSRPYGVDNRECNHAKERSVVEFRTTEFGVVRLE